MKQPAYTRFSICLFKNNINILKVFCKKNVFKKTTKKKHTHRFFSARAALHIRSFSWREVVMTTAVLSHLAAALAVHALGSRRVVMATAIQGGSAQWGTIRPLRIDGFRGVVPTTTE